MQDKLPLAQAFAQRCRQGRLGRCGRLHLWVKEAQRVAAGRLGLVHGQIGLLEPVGQALRMVVQQGHADAAGAVIRLAGQFVGLRQGAQDGLGHLPGTLASGLSLMRV